MIDDLDGVEIIVSTTALIPAMLKRALLHTRYIATIDDVADDDDR